MTPEQVYAFLDTAKPGDQCVYYRGYLAWDRANFETGRAENFNQRLVNVIGDIALASYKEGKVFITQRKLGERDYEYIMLRRMERSVERFRARHMPSLYNSKR